MLRLKGEKGIEKGLRKEVERMKKILEERKKASILKEWKNKEKDEDIYELSNVLKLDGEEFVKIVYEAILLREPDPTGMSHFLSRLLSGDLRKVEIIAGLKLSPEGREKKSRLRGLWKAILISSLYKIPIFGKIAESIGFFFTLPSFLTRIRVIEGNLWKTKKELFETKERFVRRAEKIEERTKKIEDDLFERDVVPEIWKEDLSPEIMVSNKEFYAGFEEVFRGKREKIRERQRFYVKLLERNFKGNEELRRFPVLDVGCGRGEFLEILKERGIKAIGIELRKEAVSELKNKGFKVYLKDGILFLKKSDHRFSAISSFHVIEHMDWEKLKKFILIAKERLCEGGLIMLETPNPWNREAFARFFLDYTHKRPIVPELLVFLLKWAGFRDIEVYYFSPLKRKKRIKEGLKELYLDYGVIGRK